MRRIVLVLNSEPFDFAGQVILVLHANNNAERAFPFITTYYYESTIE